MDCQSIARWIRQDAEMDRGDAGQVLEKHLAWCPACKRLSDRHQKIVGWLGGLLRRGAPDRLVWAVRRFIETDLVPFHPPEDVIGTGGAAEELTGSLRSLPREPVPHDLWHRVRMGLVREEEGWRPGDVREFVASLPYREAPRTVEEGVGRALPPIRLARLAARLPAPSVGAGRRWLRVAAAALLLAASGLLWWGPNERPARYRGFVYHEASEVSLPWIAQPLSALDGPDPQRLLRVEPRPGRGR